MVSWSKDAGSVNFGIETTLPVLHRYISLKSSYAHAIQKDQRLSPQQHVLTLQVMQWTFGCYWLLLHTTVPVSTYIKNHKNLYIMISCDITRYGSTSLGYLLVLSQKWIRSSLWNNAQRTLPDQTTAMRDNMEVKSGCWTLLEWNQMTRHKGLEMK